jgi:hypothetical protein
MVTEIGILRVNWWRAGEKYFRFLLISFRVMKIFLLISTAISTRVQYHLAASERACFFTEVKRPNEKLSFYFAVQEGGEFDIDFDVTDPDQKSFFSGQAELEGEYIFSSRGAGEYSFCFFNTMATYKDKLVEFAITVEHEVAQYGYIKSDIHEVKKADEAKKTDTENAMDELTRLTSGSATLALTKLQRYNRILTTKEARNKSVVQSTETRILRFAMLESVIIIALAAVQVLVIQAFFGKNNGYGRV